MKRLNLNLSEEEFDFLSSLSKTRNEPLSHVVREGIRLRRLVAEAEARGARVKVEDAEGEVYLL